MKIDLYQYLKLSLGLALNGFGVLLIYKSITSEKQNVYEKVRGISGGIFAIIIGITIIFNKIEF